LSGRNFSLKEMETILAVNRTQANFVVRKELLSERDGNFLSTFRV